MPFGIYSTDIRTEIHRQPNVSWPTAPVFEINIESSVVSGLRFEKLEGGTRVMTLCEVEMYEGTCIIFYNYS